MRASVVMLQYRARWLHVSTPAHVYTVYGRPVLNLLARVGRYTTSTLPGWCYYKPFSSILSYLISCPTKIKTNQPNRFVADLFFRAVFDILEYSFHFKSNPILPLITKSNFYQNLVQQWNSFSDSISRSKHLLAVAVGSLCHGSIRQR